MSLFKLFTRSSQPKEPTLQELLNEHFHPKDIEILVSPWGQSQLKKAVNANNLDMKPDMYVFYAQPTLRLETIASAYDIAKNSRMVGPTLSRAFKTKAIVSDILREGRQLSHEERLKFTAVLAHSTPDKLLHNSTWIELQERIKAHNTNNPSANITEMASLEQLGTLYDVGKMYKDKMGLDADKVPDIASHIKSAIIIYTIIEDMAKSRDLNKGNPQNASHVQSNVVQLFPPQPQ